jgi:type I restriction enzyme S subunit
LPSIPLSKVCGLQISLASTAEQNQIVNVLEELFSDLDNAIENLKKAQEQIRIFRQAVLKQAFIGKLTEKWRCNHKIVVSDRTHFPEAVSEGLGDLPRIPNEWFYTYFSKMGDLGRGKSKHRPRNDPKLFGGKYPFIQTGEIRAAKNVLREYSETYNEIGLAQSKLWPAGTLCITIAANIAETAFLGIKACFPDSIVGYTAYESMVSPKFIDYFIQSTKQKIQAYAPATAQKNINLTILENLLIPYCHLKEQEKIVQEIESRFSVCDQLEQTIETNLQKAESLRQSILKQAFEGKLTERWRKDHKDLISGQNSAEALLKKIMTEKAALNGKAKRIKNHD